MPFIWMSQHAQSDCLAKKINLGHRFHSKMLRHAFHDPGIKIELVYRAHMICKVFTNDSAFLPCIFLTKQMIQLFKAPIGCLGDHSSWAGLARAANTTHRKTLFIQIVFGKIACWWHLTCWEYHHGVDVGESLSCETNDTGTFEMKENERPKSPCAHTSTSWNQRSLFARSGSDARSSHFPILCCLKSLGKKELNKDRLQQQHKIPCRFHSQPIPCTACTSLSFQFLYIGHILNKMKIFLLFARLIY